MATRRSKLEKMKRICQQFNARGNGSSCHCWKHEVKFSDEQISAILAEIFQTYDEFIDNDKGLTYEGLLYSYNDGADDINRDFNSLGFKFILDGNKKIIYEASSSSMVEECTIESQKKQMIMTWAVWPNHDIIFDDT